VANRWTGKVTVPITTKSTLAAVLKGVLAEVFGPNANLSQYVLRLDCRHGFMLGDHRAVNPFQIFPNDYKYIDLATAADAVAKSYASWLGGSSTEDLLKVIAKPEFLLGLQVAREDASMHRVLLEVEELSFDAQSAPP
jgi:hypothetical protein